MSYWNSTQKFVKYVKINYINKLKIALDIKQLEDIYINKNYWGKNFKKKKTFKYKLCR